MSSSSMMSFLSMVEAELPPGFRFHPRDDELVCDYLAPKLTAAGFSARHHQPPMVDVDLNKVEPWDLPAAASVGPREWYFFSLKDRKYATGQRTNRATASGYWKATGKDRPVARRGALVGMRKTLVFYQGRAPKGRKTEWVMHEYRTTIEGHHLQPSSPSPSPNNKQLSSAAINNDEDWVLCRVICKKKSVVGGGGAASSSNKPAAARSGRLTTTNGRHGTTAMATTSSLPPLMDTTLAQLHAAAMTNATTTGGGTAAGAAIGQVPCFSSFSNNNSTVATVTTTNSIGIIGNAAQQQQPPPCYLLQLPSTVSTAAGSSSATMSYLLDHGGSSTGQMLPELVGTCCGYDPLNSDKKLLKAVLSQLGGDVVAPGSLSSSSSPDVAAANSTWMNHYF